MFDLSVMLISWIQVTRFIAAFGLAIDSASAVWGQETASPHGRNAVAFEQALHSEGVFALRERQAAGPWPERAATGVIGIMAVEGGQMRFLVTWPLGPGRRATYSGVISRRGNERALYTGVRYDGVAREWVAYALQGGEAAALDWGADPSLHEASADDSPLGAFTIESAAFVDYWQRVR